MGGFAASVALLLEHGALAESMDGNCRTAMVYAAERAYAGLVRVLIDAEVNLEMSNCAEYCPSGFVQSQKNIFWEKRMYLYRGRGGKNPLMNAVIGRHRETVDLLLHCTPARIMESKRP